MTARFEISARNDDKFGFVLKSANGQVIGQSQMYGTTTARDNGIRAVMASAPLATVVDNTRP